MRKKILLLVVNALIFAFSAQSQIVTYYQQGFESSGENYSYYVQQGSATTVTNVFSSGSRSLKLQHSSSEVIVVTDTIDISGNASLNAFYFEFMHICDVNPLSCQNANNVAVVEFKWCNSTDWVNLDVYETAWGGGSSDYAASDSYSERSYDIWQGNTPTNSWWKRERYNLVNKMNDPNRTLANRKFQVRFRLMPRVASGSSNEGWYLDNINFRCSPNSMVLPIVNMLSYPDMMEYATSRGTKIMAEFSSATIEGMCPDSIYVVYQLGASAPIRRKTMTAVSGYTNRYVTYIPFCGYDTIVNWRLVGKDNTTNHNQATYPQDETGWMLYKNVRGKENDWPLASGPGTTNSNVLPFGNKGRFKSQMIFDSTEMAAVGYGPGAITKIQYSAASNVNNSGHQRFVIKMRNLPTDFAMSDNKFNNDFAEIVYDSSLTITQNNNSVGTINLQDTFHYAGHGLMITMIFKNTTNDPAPLSVKSFSIPASSGCGSMWNGFGYNEPIAEAMSDPFTGSLFEYGTRVQTRPAFYFKAVPNAPLMYDCGISGFVTPNDSTSGNAVGNNSVVLTLKNYGATTLNAVRIYYSVDGGATQHYDWSGNLQAGATTNVTVNNAQTYAVGYHEMLAWVDDSVTSSGARYRDHEPFNDTMWTRFVACDGPMSGTRYVGGSTPDYQTLEKFLYAVSQCGVNGPLTVKLAPGYYDPIVFPSIPGTSKTNYVKFEPSDNSNSSVVFRTVNTTTTAQYLVNLQQANHIWFNRISFSSSVYTASSVTYHVRLGLNSTGCKFTNCLFSEGNGPQQSYMFSPALLYSGGCDSLVVENCSFSRGTAAISLVGPASDNMAHGSIIRGCSFSHQGTNGVIVRNQVGAIVDSNVFDDVYANSSYVILVQDCAGPTRITRNTVFVTSGASCLGATGLVGTNSAYAVIANNMLVSEDDGTSNMLTTPLNIITANYAKVLYNSIKMNAPERSGIAAATFGGGILDHSYFYNNIVTCFDTVNFAFNYLPTSGATNYIGYNIYYSKSPILNKYDGIICTSLAAWQGHCSMDANSQNVNPAFLNSSNTDLRSYSQNVKNHGLPFPEVTNDIFGTTRSTTSSCVGAFEFSALPYDFEIIEFVEPYTEYCDAPTAAPLVVVIKNSGVNAFNPNTSTYPVTLTYSRTNTPGVMTPGFSGNIPISINIPATDTVVYNTGVTLPFPTNGLLDSTYKLYVWLTSTIDPNPANDTSFTEVTAHYHAPAPNSITTSVPYGTAATVTVNGGIQSWYPNVYTQGVSHKSEVYWYLTPTSTEPIWRGKTFTTDPLYNDTIFYIRQKRDYPLVKITEVQFKNNMPGITYPMPLWMNGATKFAIELTNVGDYPADMTGDTIMTVSNTSSLNNKVYRFPSITLQPGQSIVLQFRNNIGVVDSSQTLGAGMTVEPQSTSNLGIIYRNNGVIEDGVAFNNITSQSQWSNLSVPSTVWSGTGISMIDSTAGVFRKGYPTGGSPSNTKQYWQISSNSERMTLGTTNNNLIRFTDNGCIGDVSTVSISMVNMPDIDIAVDGLNLASGCSLGIQPLTVSVQNRGSQPSGTVVLHYNVIGDIHSATQAIALQTCVDTLPSLAPNTSINHTFSLPINYTVAYGSVDFAVTVWTERITADNTLFNDTASTVITSAFTPGLPNVNSVCTVNYGDRAVLQTITPSNDSLAWYDRNMNPLDTTNVYVTDYIYAPDTFYVTAFGTRSTNIHVGTLASTNNYNAYPSPYNPNKKYVREQYLFLAQELIDAGHAAGPINSLSFYLDTILASAGTFTLTNYTIGIGATNDATFSSNSAWHTVTNYYSAPSVTLSNSQKGWVRHTFHTPFVWDGVSNIVVEIQRTIDPNITQGAKTRYTNAGNNKVLFKNDNNNISNLTASGSRSANRPDIAFDFVDFGCEGPAAPVYVNVINVPGVDAGLTWPDGQDTIHYSSCGNINIDVNVLNMGSANFSNFAVNYNIDGTSGTYNGNFTLPSRHDTVVTIAQPALTPGRHTLRAIISIAGDTVTTNDTIATTINVRFCPGTYTIGNGGLFANFSTALDTLHNAGIDGPVVFSVLPGVYNEQITIGAIDGSSPTNTVVFAGSTGNPEDVLLTYAPTTAANYVLNIDGAEYVSFKYMKMYANGAQNYNTVVTLANSRNIHFVNNIIRVKGSVNNTNANGIVAGDGVFYFYFDSNIVDSGYYAIRTSITALGASEGFFIRNNQFTNFLYQGVYIRKANDVYITKNRITSGANANSRALTGVFVAEHAGPVTVEQNFVSLSDNRNGGKQGIKLISINGSNATRSHVYNNMTACYGIGSTGLTSCGIYIDSSTWVNVYFNTSQVYAGTASQALTTRAFSVSTTSQNIFVMNNIFSNISKGYALYVGQPANIANCNYNDYWSSADTVRLAYWGGEMPNMTVLRATNGMDVNSLNLQPYFISPQDLHLSIGTFCERAQYNTEVPRDIDDTLRPQIPSPCMGAHEFQRKIHNIAVMDILEPQMGVTDNVETDTLRVVVKLTNDGTATESNLIWWADINGISPELRSPNRTISELQPQQVLYDTTYIAMPVGIIDTQTVCIHFPLSTDMVPENNLLCTDFFLDPAFNFKADSAKAASGDGCRLQQTPVSIKLTNKGRKVFAAGTQLQIGFQAILQTTGVTVSTLPLQWVETTTLPIDVDTNTSIILNFQQPANLYPTGIAKDIVVRIRAWSSYQWDQKPLNDTSAYFNVTSKFTPSMPEAPDLHIPYATWDTIFASQTDIPPTGAAIHRPIRWHRDSVAEPFFASTNYNASCWWETPQYFHDSTYYLSCISQTGCTSYYKPVSVILNSRVPVDMAVRRVVEPQPFEVYMLDDSVKVELINYGTQPQTNIPVTYQFFGTNNALLQEVTEICTATIQPDSTYIFTFDSLIHIPSWSNSAYYKIRTWTNMANENIRLNDTIRDIYQFQALTDATYPLEEITNKVGLDITRVSFSSLDNDVAPVGHTYLNFTNATNQVGVVTSPAQLENGVQDFGGKTSIQSYGSLRALHLIKGTTDTMTVECWNSDQVDDHNTMGYVTVYIDQDRDGQFLFDPYVDPYSGNRIFDYPYTEVVAHDTIISGTPTQFSLTIPSTMRTGYTRMRVVLVQGMTRPAPADSSFQFGQIQDYLLYIEDRPVEIDVAASRIESPRNQFIGGHNGVGIDDSITVSFAMSNKGSEAVNSAQIHYAFLHPEDTLGVQTLQWNGTLDRGTSTVISLPPHVFLEGTTDVMIVTEVAGDTLTFNDTLWYQYYRAPIKRLFFHDNFEDSAFVDAQTWFVPKGYTIYTQNLWQRGYPQKANILSCVSDSNVYATNLSGLINCFNTGTRSVMYTPIFNISQVRPDTITLWLATDMAEGHLLRIEFFTFENHWATVGTGNDTLWYTSADGWTGASSGYGYIKYRFPTSLIAGDLTQRLQFRIVYTAMTETDPCDGAAFDNFAIDRKRRDVDLGVIAIAYPTAPRFGETINPRVVIKNYGLDTIYSASFGYTHYGAYLPKVGTYTNPRGLKPDSTDVFTFPTPFIVLNTFPDTFMLCAFAREDHDIYYENDSTCSELHIAPLQHDLAMLSFISPLDRIVAGDSVTVTTRIRNYGQDPISTARLTYVYNDNFVVTEEINFNDVLGHNLESFEYFNYSFHRKFRASMGMMNLRAYIDMAADDYVFNDTISKRINGISAIVDLKAREIIVDTSHQSHTEINLVIDNIGARAVRTFEVGYWYYNDISTLRTYTYTAPEDQPFAALTSFNYRFPDSLVRHNEYYRYVTAFVHTPDDNDPTNDTTSFIGTRTVDLSARRVVVEENREDSCRVRIEIQNVGNIISTRALNFTVVVNGVTLRNNGVMRELAPGITYSFEFSKKVPKSPTRTYEGYGKVTNTDDHNDANNQTSLVEVLNYFEGVPTVENSDGMVLNQNYPNPFENSTRIEFYLPESGQVRFFVIDEMGRLVYQTMDYYMSGDNSINFAEKNLSTGVYYYGIEKDGVRLMRKMMLKR